MLDQNINETLGVITGVINALGNDFNNTEVNNHILLAFQYMKNKQALKEIITVLNTDKDLLAPDCKVCSHPCGRTENVYINDYPQDVQEKALELIQNYDQYTVLELFEKVIMLPY